MEIYNNQAKTRNGSRTVYPIQLITPHLVPLPKGEETTLQFSLLDYSSKYTGTPAKKTYETSESYQQKMVKTPSPLLLGEEQGEG